MSELKIEKVVPGIVINIGTEIRGIKTTKRVDIAKDVDTDTSTEKYEVNVHIASLEDNEHAQKLRTFVTNRIKKVCAKTPIGFIAPKDREMELRQAVVECETAVDEFNNSAKVGEFVFKRALLEIEGGDHDMVANVAEGLADFLARVEHGTQADEQDLLRQATTKQLNGMTVKQVMQLPGPEKRVILTKIRAYLIRSALSQGVQLLDMLPEQQNIQVSSLVSELRNRTKKMVRAGKQDQEALDAALSRFDLAAIETMRVAFVNSARVAGEAAREANRQALDSAALAEAFDGVVIPLHKPRNIIVHSGDDIAVTM